MAKTIIIGGYGPGISGAVAEKFGAEGFSVALVARTASKLAAGVKSLEAKGIKAVAFPADLGDASAVRALIPKVHTALGPVSVLQWSAYSTDAGDMLTSEVPAIHRAFDVAVTCLIIAIQELLPGFKKQKDAAILVTNGGFGYFDPTIDAYAAQSDSMGIAVANSAKHKLVGILSHKLKGDGIYVGEAMVLGTVKGTAWDRGGATIEPATVANKFWELYQTRTEVTAEVT